MKTLTKSGDYVIAARRPGVVDRQQDRSLVTVLTDVVCVLATVGFFVLCGLYVAACDRL
jgi:hypothetical protein